MLGCTGLYLTLSDWTGLHWYLIGWVDHGQGSSGGLGYPGDPGDPGGPGGPGEPGGQDDSLDDLHSENIPFSWSKPSNRREKLRCHALVSKH